MLGKVKVNVGSKPDGAPSVPRFPAPAARYKHLAKVLLMTRMLSPEPGDRSAALIAPRPRLVTP